MFPQRPAAVALVAPPLIALATGFVLWLALSPAEVMALVTENGPIELPTAWLWFGLSFGLWLLMPSSQDRLASVASSVVFAAFGARELDLHKAWTSMSILKSRFYLSDSPVAHKLAALAVVGAVALAAVFLIKRYGMALWRDLRSMTPWSIGVATFAIALVGSKLLDRAIYGYGLPVTEGGHALVSILEELVELSLPVIGALGFAFGLRPDAPVAGHTTARETQRLRPAPQRSVARG